MLDATSFRRIITIRICYSACLDDVIVFSETLIDHIYCFEKNCVCDEVEYLRHAVTPQGLKSNNQNLHCQVFPFSNKLEIFTTVSGINIIIIIVLYSGLHIH